MTLAIVLIVSAALALAFIFRLSVSGRLQLPSRTVLQPLDVEAFRNLICPTENKYLQRCLSPSQFRRVRRARLLAMAAYVQRAAANAGVLVRLGQLAIPATDPVTQKAARQLVNDALLLRRNAAYALLQIYVALAWPSFGLGGEGLIARYERMSGSAMLLGRLQNPAMAVRLSVR